MADRDPRIAELEAELAYTRGEPARRLAARAVERRRRSVARVVDPGRFERRILAARARLRQAEHENERLRRQLDFAIDDPLARPGLPGAATPVAIEMPAGPERCLLYVRGHGALLPHLRRHARKRCLELLHHDGGEEHSPHLLEGLVGRAEAVFCPIDCVSHQACLAAKQLCRRLDKPFVPLRTGSGTCFLRAIDRWRSAAAPSVVATV